MDRLVAERRSARLLRPHREGADADPPERADQGDRGPGADEDGRRARVAELLARRPVDRLRRAAGRHRRHLQRRSRDPPGHQSHRRRLRRLRARLFAGRQVPSSTTRASAATRSCSASIWTRRRRPSSPSGPWTRRRRSSSTTNTIMFSSTATDPNLPIEPDVAKNGNIFNIWTLDLRNGELRQYTDALGGNWSAVAAERRQRRTASRSSATTRASTASARSSARSRCTRRRRRTSARRGRSSISRRRSSTRWSPPTSARRAPSRRCSSRAGRR